MFFLLDKPQGISSFKAIREFAAKHKIQKIGHTGTLDPLATGLLLVATDEDTPFIEYLDKGQKTYITKMQFGFSSNTYDIEGDIIPIGCNHHHTIAQFEQTMHKNFMGKINQIPPIFSAKKIGGQRAYDLARKGQKIEMKQQKIEVFQTEILSWDPLEKVLEVKYVVSRGTYIRSLIFDLAHILGCHAIMTQLRRTALAGVNEAFINQEINVFSLLNLPIFELTKAQLFSLIQGIRVKLDTNNKESFLEHYVLVFEQKLVGIGTIVGNLLKSKKLIGKRIEKLLKIGG